MTILDSAENAALAAAVLFTVVRERFFRYSCSLVSLLALGLEEPEVSLFFLSAALLHSAAILPL